MEEPDVIVGTEKIPEEIILEEPLGEPTEEGVTAIEREDLLQRLLVEQRLEQEQEANRQDLNESQADTTVEQQADVEDPTQFNFGLYNFEALEYAEQQGFNTPEEALDQEQINFLYDDAIKENLKKKKKELTGTDSNFKAEQFIVDNFEHGREILGKPQIADDQLVNAENFQQYLRDQNFSEAALDTPIKGQVARYVKSLTSGDGRFSHPSLRNTPDIAWTKPLEEELVGRGLDVGADFNDNTIRNFINTDVQDVDGQPPQTDSPEDQAGSIENITRGTTGGLTNVIGKTITGLFETLPEAIAGKVGDARLLSTDKEGNFSLFSFVTPEQVQQSIEERGSEAESFLGRIGDSIQELSKEIESGADQNTWAFKISKIAGELGGFVVGGAIGTGGRLAQGARALTTAVGSGSEFQVEDLEQTLLPKGETFTAEQKINSALLGGAIGSLESLPVIKALGRTIGGSNSANVIKWLDGMSDGAFKKALASAGVGAFEEGIQEATSQVLQNAVANKLVAYDPDRDLYVGIEEAGATGAGAGAVINGLLGFLSGRRAANSDAPVPTEATLPKGNEEEAVIVKDSKGVFHGVKGAQSVKGSTRDQVVADLETSEQAQVADPLTPENSTVEAVSETNIILSRSGNDLVEVVSDFPTEDLATLTTLHNSDDNFSIPKGLKVVKQDDGSYIAELGDRRRQGTDIIQAVSLVVKKETPQAFPVGRFVVRKADFKEPYELPLNEKKAGRITPRTRFKIKETVDVLKAQGFGDAVRVKAGNKLVPIDSKDIKSDLTSEIVATKDGNIYTFTARKRKGDRATTISTKIVSAQTGKKVASPLTKATGQTPIDRDGNILDGNFVVGEPDTNIKIDKETIAGREDLKIEPQAFSAFVENIDGTVIEQDTKFSSFKTSDGQIVSIYVIDGGGGKQFVAVNDGNGEIGRFTETFGIEDPTLSGRQKLGLTLDDLTSKGYTLKDLKVGKATLLSPDNETVTLNLSEKGIISTDNRVANILDKKDSIEARRVEVAADIADKQNDNIRQRFFEEDTFVDEGEQQILRADDIDVVLDTDLAGKPQMMSHIITTTEAHGRVLPDTNEQGDTTFDFDIDDWTVVDVQKYVDMLPQEIQRMIVLHTEKVNPASKRGAFGYFAAAGQTEDDKGLGPRIHIDVSNPQRSFHSVLSTLSEEVAHFSFDSWTSPALTDLYDIAWDLVGDRAVAGLGGYINKHNIDVKDPAPIHKYILVNEFFSKQGTSILNFADSKIALPPGVSQERLQQIKREVEGKVIKLSIDLNTNKNLTDKQAQEFVETVLRAQAGGVIGRGIVMQYDTRRPNGQNAKLIIRSTPFGSERTYIPSDTFKEAEKLARRRALVAGDTATHKAWGLFFKSIHPFYDTFVGRDTTLLISNAHQNVDAGYVDQLRGMQAAALSVRQILNQHGFFGVVKIEDSYLDTFQKIGVKKKNHLKIARKFDEDFQQSRVQTYDNVASILAEARRSVGILRAFALERGVPDGVLAGQIKNMQDFAQRFSVDWNHRRYRAFQADGRKALSQMEAALTPTSAQDLFKPEWQGDIIPTLSEKVTSAKHDIEILERKLENNTISLKQFSKQMAKAIEPIALNKRMLSLRQWAIDELSPSGRANGVNIRGVMLRELRRIKAEGAEKGGINSTTKLQLINSVKGRKLDPNIPKDRLYMDFLGEITDPLEVSVRNLEQQAKVIQTLRFNNELAVNLMDKGIARVKGETLIPDQGWDDQIQKFQSGSVLQFIEIDPIFSEDLRSDLDIHDAALNNQFSKAIGYMRGNATIRNPVTLMSNYTSNVSVLMHGGHLFYINRLRKAFAEGKDAWTRNIQFSRKEGEDVGTHIAEEMTRGGLFNAGAASLTIDITDGAYIDKIIKGIIGAVESTGAISGDQRTQANFFYEKLDQLNKKLYAFGDDYAKILPYILNRELGVAKAKHQIKRTEYVADISGDQQYRDAIQTFAIEFALKRTRRETVTWADSLNVIRNVKSGNARLLIGDFPMHTAQMMKIVANNAAILAEDFKEVRQLRANGQSDTQYYRTLRSRLSSRALGNSISAMGHFATGGLALKGVRTLSLTTMGVYGAMGLIGGLDDDELTPVEDKQYFTSDELNGATTVMNLQNHRWAGTNFKAVFPAARDGFKFYAFNAKRQAAVQTTAFSPIPGDNISIKDQVLSNISRQLSAFLPFLNDQETITAGIYDAFFGDFDQFGNKFNDSESPVGFDVRRFDSVSRLMLPGIVNVAGETATGRSISLKTDWPFVGFERYTQQEQALFKWIGVSAKKLDFRDTLASTGFDVSGYIRKGVEKKAMFKRLTTGDKLNNTEINNIVLKNIKSNAQAFDLAETGIKAHKQTGFTDALLVKHLQRKANNTKTGVSQKDAAKLVNGRNIFNEKNLNAFAAQIEKQRARKPQKSRGVTQEQIDNKIEALLSARIQYQKAMKNAIIR